MKLCCAPGILLRPAGDKEEWTGEEGGEEGRKKER